MLDRLGEDRRGVAGELGDDLLDAAVGPRVFDVPQQPKKRKSPDIRH